MLDPQSTRQKAGFNLLVSAREPRNTLTPMFWQFQILSSPQILYHLLKPRVGEEVIVICWRSIANRDKAWWQLDGIEMFWSGIQQCFPQPNDGLCKGQWILPKIGQRCQCRGWWLQLKKGHKFDNMANHQLQCPIGANIWKFTKESLLRQETLCLSRLTNPCSMFFQICFGTECRFGSEAAYVSILYRGAGWLWNCSRRIASWGYQPRTGTSTKIHVSPKLDSNIMIAIDN